MTMEELNILVQEGTVDPSLASPYSPVLQKLLSLDVESARWLSQHGLLDQGYLTDLQDPTPADPGVVDAEHPPVPQGDPQQPTEIPPTTVDVNGQPSGGGGGGSTPLLIGGGIGALAAILGKLGGGSGVGPNVIPPASATPATTTPATTSTAAPQTEGGGISDPNPGTPVAAESAAGGGGIAGILGKIFGVDTSKSGSGLVDELIKLGVPLTSAILNGVSASKVAESQAAASDKAAQLLSDSSKNSLDFEKQVYSDQKTQNAPFLAASTDALGKVQDILSKQKPFTAPTADEVRATPGYQLKLDEGLKALRTASKGLVSGATLKAADRFASDYADTNYGNASDRALNIFETNRNNELNPELTVAGYGPQAVSQNNAAGSNAANNVTNINSTTATGVGNQVANAAAARASGYGQGALSQVLNTLQKQQIMRQIGL